jgi:serine kinase of HPr protein (carbohydrate metabolism regulator)
LIVHATTIDLCGLGVLILGASGSGKSDLALRLICEGALLVADDQTSVDIVGIRLIAQAPQKILGLIEVRGIGLVRAPVKRRTALKLAVTLTESEIERMPLPRFWALPGQPEPKIPLISLWAFESSTTAKVRQALVAVSNA